MNHQTITDEDRWNLLQKKAQSARAASAFELFRFHGIEPILIKGLAASLNYPASKIRLSIDMDLAVSAKDFDVAQQLAHSTEAHGLAIDLHCELRHLDTVDWDDLFANSRLLQFDDGEKIRVLRPEDHLRVLAVHWLTDGGSNRDRLWDIYYSVESRTADFDWDRFLNVVDKNRRRWLVCTLGLAQRYLDLDLNGTPIKTEAKDLPAWLTRAVELEWARKIPNKPLEVTLDDPKMFATQLMRRMRPNPIWATVQMDGSFDSRTRIFYQIRNFLKRILPSLRRVFGTIKLNRSN